MRLTRRDFVKTSAIGAAGILAYKAGLRSAYALNNSPSLQKWIQPLRGLGPTGIPTLTSIPDPVFPGCNFYRVTVGEFTDILHPSLPPTRLWGYWDTTSPAPRHLGGVVITTRNTAARIRFTNTLPSRHILPLDITLPGANQQQNRIATHIHGGLVPWISDGGPFDWFTPGCTDYANGLSFLNGPGGILDNILIGNLTFPAGLPIQQGQADYYYPNNQSTRLMWYHDHALGITRLNAYAGIASAYLVVDPANDAARLTVNTPPTAAVIPIVWQDKKFVSNTTPVTDPTWADITRPDVQGVGSLWYEHTYNPKLWTLKAGLPIVDPSVIAEYFGDTILCNGTVYPKLGPLQPTVYRFMFLNATNARFLNINTFVADLTADGITLKGTTQFPGNPAGPAIRQIGTEGGYLAKEVVYTTSAATQFNPATLLGNLILGPAERADVIIDFSAFAGKDIIIYNDAPAPFPVGAPINDYYLGNAKNPIVPTAGFGPDTRQILRISIANGTPVPNNGPFLTDNGPLDPPALATLPILPAGPLTQATVIPPLTAPPGATPRPLTLNEAFDRYGRLIQMLGTTTPQAGGGFGQPLMNPATEVVTAGTMEVWQIYNTTADTHPMHFHLVNAQVLSRQPFKISGGVFILSGPALGPDVNELGWKETIKMHPGEVTSILMKFDLPTGLPFAVPPSPRTTGNEYVWHCHILEHEEHDMMRPLVIT